MTRVGILTVICVLQGWPMLAHAQAVLPQSLDSCDDVNAIVTNHTDWDIEVSRRTSDGGWTDAVIRVDQKPGSRVLSVRESDIGLFVECWERDKRSNGYANTAYESRMATVINDLFPMTERVALALTGLSGRWLGIPGRDVSEVLSALSRLAITPGPSEEDRERMGKQVVPLLRDQWWQCWDANSRKSPDLATYSCREYTTATGSWLVGYSIFDSDEQRQRSVATLAAMIDHSDDPKVKQSAVLAVFDRDCLLDATTQLALKALKERDPSVRLMAVRLSDEARLDEEGKPYDAELRRALEDIARKDPVAGIREEASKILQLKPYTGPG